MAYLRQLASGGSGQQILARIRIKPSEVVFSSCAELSWNKVPEDSRYAHKHTAQTEDISVHVQNIPAIPPCLCYFSGHLRFLLLYS